MDDSVQARKTWRILNRDGTFNVSRKGIKPRALDDIYHFSLSISWWRLLILLVGIYIVTNAFFALLYVLCGPDALSGIQHENVYQHFSDAFFFSVQTFSTIGYGKITPVSIPANLLVTMEALTGLLCVALSTGLIFARFSRPTSRVIFSNFATITKHDGVPSFVFRMANARDNQIVDARVKVSLSVEEKTKEGEKYRTFYELKLERSETAIFALSWTVVHPIDRESPLFGMSPEDLEKTEGEFIVTLRGTDETFSQTVNTRFSYTPSEVIWNKNFGDMLSREGELLYLDMAKFNTIVEPLNISSSQSQIQNETQIQNQNHVQNQTQVQGEKKLLGGQNDPH